MPHVKGKIGEAFHLAFLMLPCIAIAFRLFVWARPKEPTPEIPLQVATLERLMGLLQEREAEIQTLKGLFRAQIQGPGIPGTQRVEGAIVYHRPDALSLRGFNRLGLRLFEWPSGRIATPYGSSTGKVLTGT